MNKFSSYLKAKKPVIKELIHRLAKKYSYVSVLGTDVSGISFSVDKKSVNVAPASISECGFVVKVYHKGIYSEYSTTTMDETHLNEMIEEIEQLVAFNTINKKLTIDKLNEDAMVKSFTRPDTGRVYRSDEVITTLKEYIANYSKKYTNIVNIRTAIETFHISKLYLSDKKDLEQYYCWNNGSGFAIANREGNMKYGYDSFGATNLEDIITNLEASLDNTCQLAIELLDSELPKPGYYDIITDPSITGLIAHEAFGHGVEMDQFVKDRALAKEYINKRVASNLVNMHDGAKATLSNASYFFDDAGILAQDTKIIENGILKRGISDLTAALELGTQPTGNSRRESFKRKAYARMTNTFFDKGTSKLEDMIKSIEHGYYIGITNNGMEDPKNWGIQCTALYGREIKDGEFTGKIISPVVMSGHVIDLLESISMVSDGFTVIGGSGYCGKGYKEFVPVSDGGPHLKAKVKIG